MKRSTLALGALALGALGAAFLWPRAPEATRARSLVETYPVVSEALEGGMLLIENAHGSFALKRGPEGRLRLVRPVPAPLRDDVVQSLVAGLAGVESLARGNLPRRQGLGFDEARARIRLRGASGEVLLRLGIDVALEPSVYLEVEGDGGLWKAPRRLLEAITGDASELRARRIVGLRPFELDGVRLETGDGATVWEGLREAGVWRMRAPTPGPMCLETIRGVLDRLAGLEALAFVADGPGDLASFGLAPPRWRVILRSRAWPAPLALALGERDGRVFLYQPEWDSVVEVDPAILETLALDPRSLLANRIIPAGAGELRAIDLVRPAGEILLARPPGNTRWWILLPVVSLATPDAMDDYLDRVARLRASGWADPAAWRSLGPLAGGTDPDEMNVLLDGITRLRAASWEAPAARPPAWTTHPWISLRVETSGGASQGFVAGRGDPGGEWVPLLPRDGERVARVPEENLEVFLRPHYLLRDRVLLRIGRGELAALRVRSGSHAVEILASGVGWIRREPGAKKGEVLDPHFAGVLERRWRELAAVGFVGEDPLAPPAEAVGVEPSATVELVGRSASAERILARLHLYLGGEHPVARLEGSSLYFVLQGDTVERLKRACPFSLQERE